MSTIGFGKSHPLGATINPGGANFSVYSKNGTGAELLLFDHVDDPEPSRTIRLNRRNNRTGHYWHTFVPGVKAGQLYGWRVFGPNVPEQGLRFDPEKVLIDPYGRGVAVGSNYSRRAACMAGDNVTHCMKSVVVDPRAYDWEGDQPLKRPLAQTVIYEMHVGGFTKHPSSGIEREKRGTYAGLIEKIPYLKELGVTAVELLPVFQFDEQDAPFGLTNYWGYSPVSFFAPHSGFSSDKDPLGPVNEFRDMVKALHLAGIEVILDVVYNHTSENGTDGPTLSLRGLENRSYYILEENRSRYANFSGCGNTLNANHSLVRQMIVDSLHHWVQLMHVDGFRFDLASILSRDTSGEPLQNPPLLWEIESDPVLAGTKLIAEAWDAGGLYQVGHFLGDFWTEWNGPFRDDVRNFWRGERNTVKNLSHRLWGSPDLYGHEEREPEQSINFVTCHDGFTINDLVSYNRKHNEANGEFNRDGTDYNASWNCGVEGPKASPEVEKLRSRQIKNMLTTTMLSLGVPMLLMGDEVRRTQRGNNNGYAQDNDISWFDWRLLEKHRDLFRFVQQLIQLKMTISYTQRPDHIISLNQVLRDSPVYWHGVKLNHPDWSEHSHSIAFSVRSMESQRLFHVIMNAYWGPLRFELPSHESVIDSRWRRLIDTSLDSPNDILSFDEAPNYPDEFYVVQPRSMVVLVSEH